MSHLTLVIGGARSGKSLHAHGLAEEFAGANGAVTYIATAEAREPEMEARIARHKSVRPAHWRTMEAPLKAAAAVSGVANGVVLLDCLTLYTTNHLLAASDPLSDDAGLAVEESVRDLLGAIAAAAPTHTVLVTNEVGLGIVPDTPLGRVFRDIAGRCNQMAAAAADDVVWMVAGIPVKIK